MVQYKMLYDIVLYANTQVLNIGSIDDISYDRIKQSELECMALRYYIDELHVCLQGNELLIDNGSHFIRHTKAVAFLQRLEDDEIDMMIDTSIKVGLGNFKNII